MVGWGSGWGWGEKSKRLSFYEFGVLDWFSALGAWVLGGKLTVRETNMRICLSVGDCC